MRRERGGVRWGRDDAQAPGEDAQSESLRLLRLPPGPTSRSGESAPTPASGATSGGLTDVL